MLGFPGGLFGKEMTIFIMLEIELGDRVAHYIDALDSMGWWFMLHEDEYWEAVRS